MKTKEKSTKTYIGWILLIILAVVVLLIHHSTIIKIITRFGLMFLSFSGVAVIFYAFAGIFTKKCLIKWIVTICLCGICVFIYIEHKRSPRVIHMKEDIMYVLPKSDTIRK